MEATAQIASRPATAGALTAVQHGSWSALVERFRAPGANGSGVSSVAAVGPTPFQAGNWLRAWYDTLGAQAGVEPLPLEIRDVATGAPLFGVPLVKRREGSQHIVEFADGTLTDYNAPLLRSDTQSLRESVSAAQLLAVLRPELRGCDQLRFTKLPMTLAGAPNPFAALPGGRESRFGTNLVSVTDDWAEYRRDLAKKVRKELERSFRVFQRDGRDAKFAVIRDSAEAISILERMESLQAQRMRELGLPFVLNEPQFAAFYRRLIELDVGNGGLMLTVLKSEPDELVGALLGLVDGEDYAMIRLAHAGKAWSHCSPGKLMIDQTMQYLHSQGVRRFDFTTGDYSYKKSFLAQSEPLTDVVHGLSVRGKASLASAGMAATVVEVFKNQLRRSPKLYAAFKRAGGSPIAN